LFESGKSTNKQYRNARETLPEIFNFVERCGM
jgi:hypothetical protein